MRQNRKTDQYRTLRVNSFFSYIPVITKDVDNKKTGKFRVKTKNSSLVLEAGQISNFLKEDIQLILVFNKQQHYLSI